MKRKTYIRSCLCMVIFVFLHWNCTDYELAANRQTQNKDFSLQEAREFFETQMEQPSSTTRAVEETNDRRIVPGEFTPKWENAVASSCNGLSCYDIPIAAHYRYKAMYSDFVNGKATARIVNVYQKLLVVKKSMNGQLGHYILTLIPTKEYENQNKKAVCDNFVNCADKGGFSGLAIYSMTRVGLVIRADQYENGVKKRGVFLIGKRETLKERIILLRSILKGIKFTRTAAVSTRGFGEDDWWGDNWRGDDWEYGSDDSGSSDNDWVYDPNNYWDIGAGFFYDEVNDQVLYDYDGDGKPDSVWLPDVDITPDEPGENPIPDPDPFPEPEPEPDPFPEPDDDPVASPPSVPPVSKAKKLFRNSRMTAANWSKLEKMLEKIMRDCMGEALVNGLEDMLNGKTLSIQFSSEGSSFGFDVSAGITLGMDMESNQLFHEMWHAYQAYHESVASYNSSTLNLEIEAHYAQYLYLQSLPEFGGSKWEQWYQNDDRCTSIAHLSLYIDSHGNFIQGSNYDLFDVYVKFGVVDCFRKESTYSNYPYNDSRSGISNFSNLQELTKDC